MTSEYKLRHIVAKEILMATAKKKIKKGDTLTVCAKIGEKLEVSTQTVYNYIKGRVTDGYLVDSIVKELNKLKNIN